MELQQVLLTQFLCFWSNYYDCYVYSAVVGSAIRLKAEDSNDPTKSVETQVLSTVANAWEIIVFDFSSEVSGTALIDFSYTYDKLSIFYDFGNSVGDLYMLDEVLLEALFQEHLDVQIL